jgi:hypothetical protein
MTEEERLQAQERIKNALKIARNIDLIDVRFVHTQATLKKYAKGDGIDEELTINISCVGAGPLTTEEEKEAIGFPGFPIYLKFELEAFTSGGSEKICAIEAIIGALYKLKEEPEEEYTEEEFTDFSLINGRLHLWPYWREYVQSTFGRFGLQKVVVPVFRVGQSNSKPKQQEEEEGETGAK